MRYAVGKGCFIVVAAGNEFEVNDPTFGLNPTSTLAEIASRIPGVISVGAVDRAKARAYYSSTGPYVEIAAPGGSERGFGRDGFVWQQTFDFTYTDTFDLPPAQFVAPRFDEVAEPKAFMARNALILRNTTIGNFFDLCSISLPLPRRTSH